MTQKLFETSDGATVIWPGQPRPLTANDLILFEELDNAIAAHVPAEKRGLTVEEMLTEEQIAKVYEIAAMRIQVRDKEGV